MPKISLSLQAAKAKDGDILAKLQKVQQFSQNQKQQTRLNQQRSEWTEQARKLASEARRLEDDLQDAVTQLGLFPELAEERQAADELAAEPWFQIAGVRQLVAQLQLRDAERLRRAPDQALELQEVLTSVAAAISGLGVGLTGQAAFFEQECLANRRDLRRDLEAAWGGSSEKHAAENCCDLSDEEDTLLDRLGGGECRKAEEDYDLELRGLNDQVTRDLSELEKELKELRQKRTGWDDEAHFRFVCIKRQLHGKRDLLMDRLLMEFPHLSHQQLQAHEAHVDSLKYAEQKKAAAFRQWRRERYQLLRRHQGRLEERQREQEALQARRVEHLEHRGRQQVVHERLDRQRSASNLKKQERQRSASRERKRREAEEVEKEQVYRKRVQATKDLALQHEQKLREVKLQQQEEAAERERKHTEERARRRERNAEVVRLRREMDDLKQREAAQARQAAEQEQRTRERRLQQAIEKLRVEAPRDPERLLKLPEHSKNEAYMDPYQCVTRGPHAGFDEKRLMGDARYKLSCALQAAGIFNTRAGHEAMAQVAAPRPAQQHIVSQVFASGYPS